MFRFLFGMILLVSVSVQAKTVDGFVGCKFVIPGYYKAVDEIGATYHFRSFKKGKSLELISFYDHEMLTKKYAEHEYLKLVHSNSSDGIQFNSYQLKDESVGFGQSHIELVLSKSNQTVVFVTDDFDAAEKILSKCIDDSALNEHRARLTLSN